MNVYFPGMTDAEAQAELDRMEAEAQFQEIVEGWPYLTWWERWEIYLRFRYYLARHQARELLDNHPRWIIAILAAVLAALVIVAIL